MDVLNFHVLWFRPLKVPPEEELPEALKQVNYILYAGIYPDENVRERKKIRRGNSTYRF